MTGVKLSIRQCEDHVVAALRGELDITGSASTASAIGALTDYGQLVVIDAAALEFMDCSSLGALLEVQRRARQAGFDLQLAAPRPMVRRLLTLTGKASLLGVHASVSAAMTACGAPRAGALASGLR